VIEQGRIVERGTHDQLYVARGRYRELYDKQHGLESNLFLAPGEGDISEATADASGSEKAEGEGVTDALRLVGGE
jgi:subfamily B ATP-binding cassette protein MsbA